MIDHVKNYSVLCKNFSTMDRIDNIQHRGSPFCLRHFPQKGKRKGRYFLKDTEFHRENRLNCDFSVISVMNMIGKMNPTDSNVYREMTSRLTYDSSGVEYRDGRSYSINMRPLRGHADATRWAKCPNHDSHDLRISRINSVNLCVPCVSVLEKNIQHRGTEGTELHRKKKTRLI